MERPDTPGTLLRQRRLRRGIRRILRNNSNSSLLPRGSIPHRHSSTRNRHPLTDTLINPLTKQTGFGCDVLIQSFF